MAKSLACIFNIHLDFQLNILTYYGYSELNIVTQGSVIQVTLPLLDSPFPSIVVVDIHLQGDVESSLFILPFTNRGAHAANRVEIPAMGGLVHIHVAP